MLTEKENLELMKLLEWQSWSQNPSAWIDDCLVTRDEADEGKIKPFPKKDYLYLVDQRFVEEPILAIPKSRRMIITWRLLALHLWHGIYNSNQVIFVQSKIGEDSAYLLGEDRMMFLYSHLPAGYPWPKLTRKLKDNSGKGYETVQFDNGTSYYAVSEGADQLRQYTASRVYCTEMAFWEKAEATWNALLPTIQGGGKICIDSSAEPGFFFRELLGMCQ